MIYNSERDLRHLFKNTFLNSLLFVEWNIGGTEGISDCILLLPNKQCVFIELKRNKGSNVRASQKKFFKRCLKYDQYVLMARWQENNTVEILRLGLRNNKVEAIKSAVSNGNTISLKAGIYEVLSIRETVC